MGVRAKAARRVAGVGRGRSLVPSTVFLVVIVEGAGSGACNCANPRSLSATGQGADPRAAGGAQTYAFRGLHVPLMTNLPCLASPARAGAGPRRRSHTRDGRAEEHPSGK